MQEFERILDHLLYIFEARQGQPVTHKELLRRVWGYQAPRNLLRGAVEQLRKRGHDIRTLQGRGFVYFWPPTSSPPASSRPGSGPNPPNAT